ncbi:hypothetical protein, conserved [Leishmania tarentolae]|uniref:Uncharacterized protein n=1 Tax=Leishmania tarentolae TaxID=5689 RepID=A0A640KGA4_LEITA|nr:hypothetical protein, conserved [Leishmania tarentolae]
MLATVLHVLLFVAGLIGLLAIKKQRLRHIPIRRTHIPRRNAEGTIWLQRFVNALLDMLHSALAEKQARETVEAAAAEGSVAVSPPPPEQVLRAPVDICSSMKLSTPASCDGAVCNDDADSVSSAEVLSELPFLNTLKAQLEEQISALLEDKGIASFADFRVKDWGGKPPVIKALYLSHGGGWGSGSTASSVTGASAPSSAATAAPLGGGLGGRNSLDSMGAGGVAAVVQQRAAAGIPLSSPSGIGKQTQQKLQQQQSQHPQMSSPVSGESFSYTNLMPPLAAATVSAERQGDINVDGLKTNVRSAVDPSMMPSLRYRGSGDEFGAAAGVGTAVRERSVTGSMAHSARPSGSAGAHGGADLSSPVAGSSSAATAAGVTSAHTCGARRATDTTRSLSVLDAEVEVEYSGNFSVSLNADLPIARGRYLQVYVSLSDVRMLAAHVRLRLSLEYEPATVESPQPQPYLSGKLWLLSDPMFDAAFHSTLTQYRIRDFFMVPVLVKFFLLRFVRTKLRPFSQTGTSTRSPGSHRRRAGAGASGKMGNAASGVAPGTGVNQSASGSSGMSDDVNEDAQNSASDASGLSFRVPLPADVVDGGEHWWSSIARSSMSEQAVPFTNAYYVR